MHTVTLDTIAAHHSIVADAENVRMPSPNGFYYARTRAELAAHAACTHQKIVEIGNITCLDDGENLKPQTVVD